MSFETPAAYFRDFGTTATVAGAPVRGLLEQTPADAFGLVSGVTPSFIVATADLGAAARDSAVVVDGVSYTVRAIEPEGPGMTRLHLEQA